MSKSSPFISYKKSLKSKDFVSGVVRKNIYDGDTGEAIGHKVLAFDKRTIDTGSFIKIFTTDISWLLLSSSGLNILQYIFDNLILNTDIVELNISAIMKKYQYKSRSSVYTGISELESKQIICKKDGSEYFINPSYFFKGNRSLL